jgi:hypothetical protein
MMHRPHARNPRLLAIALAATLVISCGGARERDEARTTDESQPTAQGSGGGSVARADFVLCPAIEGIADDLASIIGFKRDMDRPVKSMTGECFVRGRPVGFVSVALAPAVIQSVAMQASGYEAQATPASDLGEGAVLIQDRMQPHVIFTMLGQVIDVGAELEQGTPNTAAMIEAAKRVREALATANGG